MQLEAAQMHKQMQLHGCTTARSIQQWAAIHAFTHKQQLLREVPLFQECSDAPAFCVATFWQTHDSTASYRTSAFWIHSPAAAHAKVKSIADGQLQDA